MKRQSYPYSDTLQLLLLSTIFLLLLCISRSECESTGRNGP